jgi:hypothetical protein
MNHAQFDDQVAVAAHRTTRRVVVRLAVAGAVAPLLGLQLPG